MIIDYDRLIAILMEHAEWDANDASPDKAFAIRFGVKGEHGYKETAERELVNGMMIYLDIADNGLVKGIEFR